MRFQAVLFDLDGTLLDTIEDLTDTMNAALAALDAPQRSIEECKQFVGDGLETYARRALPEDRRDEQTVARCVELARADYAERWAKKTRPYEGIEDLLGELHGRGMKLGVLSNKPNDFTREMVGHFFNAGDFDVIQGARPDVPKKPDPAAAIEIAKRFGIPAEKFLYVGDTDTDMKTGVGAGMHTVGVLWGFRSRQELIDNGAETLIGRPGELLSLLD
jgi:phosphoglycolate phosphatase